MRMMRKLWFAAALFLAASGATAQEPTCAAQIQTANAMMEELQEQMQVMSARAAQHYGRAQMLLAELDDSRAEIARLKEEQ